MLISRPKISYIIYDYIYDDNDDNIFIIFIKVDLYLKYNFNKFQHAQMFMFAPVTML